MADKHTVAYRVVVAIIAVIIVAYTVFHMVSLFSAELSTVVVAASTEETSPSNFTTITSGTSAESPFAGLFLSIATTLTGAVLAALSATTIAVVKPYTSSIPSAIAYPHSAR